MKIKKLLAMSMSLIMLFVSAACAEEDSEQLLEEEEPSVTTEENLETEEPDDDNEPEETEEVEENSNLGKRSNPVKLGQWIEFNDTYSESMESMERIEGTFRLRIIDVIRGDEAYEQLVSENQFNDPAPEGYEWVIITMEIEMIDGSVDAPYTVVAFNNIVSSTGSEVSQDDYATLDGNEYGYIDLFPGGSHSGRETKYVPIDDESLFVYGVGFDTQIYFELTGDVFVEEESSDTPDDAGENDGPEEPVVKGDVGKRSNPVPIGEWMEFKDTYYASLEDREEIEGAFKLRITEVIRGDAAYEQLVAENQFNDPAPEGYEWVIITIEIEMIDGSEDVPYTIVAFNNVISSAGSEVAQDDYASLDGNEYGYVDLFPGGTHSGRETKYVPIGDASLFVYEYGLDSQIYFSLSE